MKKYLICLCLFLTAVFCFAEEKEYKNAIGIGATSTGHIESSTLGVSYQRDFTKNLSLDTNVMLLYFLPFIDDIQIGLFNVDLQLNYYFFDYSLAGNMKGRFYAYGHAGTSGILAFDFKYIEYEGGYYAGIGLGSELIIAKRFSIPVEFGLMGQLNHNRTEKYYFGPEAGLGIRYKF